MYLPRACRLRRRVTFFPQVNQSGCNMFFELTVALTLARPIIVIIMVTTCAAWLVPEHVSRTWIAQRQPSMRDCLLIWKLFTSSRALNNLCNWFQSVWFVCLYVCFWPHDLHAMLSCLPLHVHHKYLESYWSVAAAYHYPNVLFSPSFFFRLCVSSMKIKILTPS